MKLRSSPVLVITDNSRQFIKHAADSGCPVISGDLDYIIEGVSALRNAKLDKPMIVGDISPDIVGYGVEQQLLKVLEELKADAMFVTSRDCFSDIFMSRFREIIKNVRVRENRLNSKASMLQLMRSDEEVSFPIMIERIITEAPEFVPFVMRFRKARIPSKDKLLELL